MLAFSDPEVHAVKLLPMSAICIIGITVPCPRNKQVGVI